MRIRAKSFRNWMKATFTKNTLSDIANNGANCGYVGLIYYEDTTSLYEKFKEEIWEMLMEDMESCGYDNVFELMAGFGGAQNVLGPMTFENLMVWYAAETIAREMTER